MRSFISVASLLFLGMLAACGGDNSADVLGQNGSVPESEKIGFTGAAQVRAVNLEKDGGVLAIYVDGDKVAEGIKPGEVSAYFEVEALAGQVTAEYTGANGTFVTAQASRFLDSERQHNFVFGPAGNTPSGQYATVVQEEPEPVNNDFAAVASFHGLSNITQIKVELIAEDGTNAVRLVDAETYFGVRSLSAALIPPGVYTLAISQKGRMIAQVPGQEIKKGKSYTIFAHEISGAPSALLLENSF